MIKHRVLITAFLLLVASALAYGQSADNPQGFLDKPPIFIDNEPDIPLTGMGTEIPKPGKVILAFDAQSQQSSEFRSNGVNVQPTLNLKLDIIRIGALAGFKDDWAAGISIPWQRTRINGNLGTFPAGTAVEAVGGISLIGKKAFWKGCAGQRAVVTAGVQLPNGLSTATFGESNPSTNRYYINYPARLPLGWQPSTGTWNGYLALAYGTRGHRLSYEGIFLEKLYSSDDEDTKVGNIFIASINATYGISRTLAGSLGVTLRSQADDSYPEAPSPGVDAPPLMGTTTHGTTLYIDPSIRFVVDKQATIGIGFRLPAILPDNGMVPNVQVSFIAYPSM